MHCSVKRCEVRSSTGWHTSPAVPPSSLSGFQMDGTSTATRVQAAGGHGLAAGKPRQKDRDVVKGRGEHHPSNEHFRLFYRAPTVQQGLQLPRDNPATCWQLSLSQVPPASEAMLVAAKELWPFMRCSGDWWGSAAHRLCCKEGAGRLLRGNHCSVHWAGAAREPHWAPAAGEAAAAAAAAAAAPPGVVPALQKNETARCNLPPGRGTGKPAG